VFVICLTFKPNAGFLIQLTHFNKNIKQVKKKILYEQPLNERMRNLLRLEHLFIGIMYRLKGPAEWDNRAVMDNLIEILEFIARIEFKRDLLKDLEHNIQTLTQWQRTPDINTERLAHLIDKTKALKEKIEQNQEHLGENLSQHQLIQLVRQRRSIAGGDCRCDLPAYSHWLQKNPKQRQVELNEWLTPLLFLRDAIDVILYLIRQNAITSQQTAPNGLFQSQPESMSQCQIIQVILPIEHPCYPEITGSKQRLIIRFFEQPMSDEPPYQTEQSVHFKLCCCVN